MTLQNRVEVKLVPTHYHVTPKSCWGWGWVGLWQVTTSKWIHWQIFVKNKSIKNIVKLSKYTLIISIYIKQPRIIMFQISVNVALLFCHSKVAENDKWKQLEKIKENNTFLAIALHSYLGWRGKLTVNVSCTFNYYCLHLTMLAS